MVSSIGEHSGRATPSVRCVERASTAKPSETASADKRHGGIALTKTALGNTVGAHWPVPWAQALYLRLPPLERTYPLTIREVASERRGTTFQRVALRGSPGQPKERCMNRRMIGVARSEERRV